MRLQSIIVLAGIFIIQGCAFKGKPGNEAPGTAALEPAPVASSEPAKILEPQVNPLDGSVASVTLTWGEGQRKVLLNTKDLTRRDAQTWVREVPVSIPAVIPEKLMLEVLLKSDPQGLSKLRAEITSVSGEGLGSQSLGVEDVKVTADEQGSRVSLTIKDLRLLLSNTREQRIYLNLVLSQEGSASTQLRLALTTPPSEWSMVKRESRSKMAGAGALPLTLTNQAMTLTLVERVVFKNLSSGKAKLRVPFRLAAKTQVKLKNYSVVGAENPNPHVIAYKQAVADEMREQATDLLVIPAVENVAERWTEFAADEKRDVTLSPGQELEVGLYAPIGLRDFVEPLRKLKAATVPAQSDAKATCPNSLAPTIPGSTNGDEGRSYCVAVNNAGYGFPEEALQACTNSIRWMRQCIASSWAAEPCNQAALADDRVDQLRRPHPANGIPWPLWFGCRRYDVTSDNRTSYIHNGWVWEPVFSNFLNGLTAVGASLKISDGEAVFGDLRFETGHAEGDQESRPLKLFGPEFQTEGLFE